jgi:predicted amidohydrolase
MKVVVATCQLPTSADTEANLHHVLAQMREAKAGGAQVAHFREGCLSGYAGTDFKSFANFNWALLETSTHKALEAAREPICSAAPRIAMLVGTSAFQEAPKQLRAHLILTKF